MACTLSFNFQADFKLAWCQRESVGVFVRFPKPPVIVKTIEESCKPGCLWSRDYFRYPHRPAGSITAPLLPPETELALDVAENWGSEQHIHAQRAEKNSTWSNPRTLHGPHKLAPHKVRGRFLHHFWAFENRKKIGVILRPYICSNIRYDNVFSNGRNALRWDIASNEGTSSRWETRAFSRRMHPAAFSCPKPSDFRYARMYLIVMEIWLAVEKLVPVDESSWIRLWWFPHT